MTLFLAKNYVQSSDFYFKGQHCLENQDEAQKLKKKNAGRFAF